ncbi:hypothetical protein VPH35_130279 [Triticum aestivum]
MGGPNMSSPSARHISAHTSKPSRCSLPFSLLGFSSPIQPAHALLPRRPLSPLYRALPRTLARIPNTMDAWSGVSADAAAAGANGLGGGWRADVEAAAATSGLGGWGEASAELLDVEAYVAPYSGRTRLARLMAISYKCGVEAIQFEALRVAHDEAKAGEDTMFYLYVVREIDGRLGQGYLLDQAWVDSVNRRAEQRKETLLSQLQIYQSNQIKESIRMGYNQIGDFYFAHGHLSEAFKSYIATEEHCSTSEHAIQMCMNAIHVNLELCDFARVLNYASKAKGSQDPLSPITTAKLQAVEGLGYLGQQQYKLAALQFIETGPELGSNYSEVIAPQDVATYGALCALALFNYTEIKTKVVENVQFGSFLDLVPEVKDLVNAFYYSQRNTCMEVLERLKQRLMMDLHLGHHMDFLCLLISQKLEFMPSTVCDFSTLYDLLMKTPSPINEEQPRVNANGPQLNSASNLILPENFNDETLLAESSHYKFLKSKDLFDSLGRRKHNWVSTCQARALLQNAILFVVDDFDSEARDARRTDGQVLMVSDARFSMLKVVFGSYTTTTKPLKEKLK